MGGGMIASSRASSCGVSFILVVSPFGRPAIAGQAGWHAAAGWSIIPSVTNAREDDHRMDTAYDGLYALASLDGAALAARDLAVLGLAAGSGGIALAARDLGRDLPVAERHAFLGHLDEPAALAAALGRDRATPPAALLAAALARYGDDTPAHAPGEWSFAAWDAPTRTLTLMVSDTARDALLYATDGARVAVGPHIRTLRHLDGVDATPDGAALLLHLGRGPLRGTIGDRTILRDVRRVTAGTRVRISPAGVRVGGRAALPEPTRWRGSFDDAIEALGAVWRTIMRQQMARYPHAAVMLSGGLDSSLIAAFAAAERGSEGGGGTLVALCSAAPPGSGLADEVAVARAVAGQAGIALAAVAPGPDADVYLPSPAMLRWHQHPLVGPRHHVYDALYRAAATRGAHAIFDGSGGEATLTGYADALFWRARLRALAARARRLARRGVPAGGALIDPAFHVRLSADARALAAAALPAECDLPPPAPPHARGDLWGYAAEIDKLSVSLTTTPLPGLRSPLPLLDRRLVTLFAGMPYSFIDHAGVTRAPARALLSGMVPESVRLRRRGLPFSPDYRDRIRAQAGRARTRIPGFVAAGAGEWLDLAWLDTALGAIAGGADVSLDTIHEVQTTATAAAFVADWTHATA